MKADKLKVLLAAMYFTATIATLCTKVQGAEEKGLENKSTATSPRIVYVTKEPAPPYNLENDRPPDYEAPRPNNILNVIRGISIDKNKIIVGTLFVASFACIFSLFINNPSLRIKLCRDIPGYIFGSWWPYEDCKTFP